MQSIAITFTELLLDNTPEAHHHTSPLLSTPPVGGRITYEPDHADSDCDLQATQNGSIFSIRGLRIRMKADSIFAGVQESMGTALGIPPNRISHDSTMENLENWDSLQHINVIMDIEAKFNIMFEAEEIPNLNTVAAIVRSVSDRIAQASAKE